MAVPPDITIPNMVGRLVDECVLLTRMVPDVPAAKVRDVGTDEAEPEALLVREVVYDMGDGLADLQTMPQA